MNLFKNKPKVKVFCEDCKWHNPKPIAFVKDGVLTGSGSGNSCSSPYTISRQRSSDSPVSKGSGKVWSTHYNSCYSLNRNNNCVWFNQN